METPVDPRESKYAIYGDHADNMEKLDKSREDLESAFSSSIYEVDGTQKIESGLTAHTENLQKTVFDITSDTTYTNEEKSALIALVLTEDDTNRVEFLKSITDEEDEELFLPGYDDYEVEASRILRHLNELDWHPNSDEFISKMVNKHAVLMAMDTMSFLNSNFAQRHFKEAKRKDANKQNIRLLAVAGAAAFLGSLVSNAIWEYAKRRNS